MEISFTFNNNYSVTEQLYIIKNYAQECFCEDIYEDFEFDNIYHNPTTKCVINISFLYKNIYFMIKFLNFIKKYRNFYVEMIYDENNQQLLYASQYYISKKMNKKCAKEYKEVKRKRSYSNDENDILKCLAITPLDI